MRYWIQILSAIVIGCAVVPIALAQNPNGPVSRPNGPPLPQNGRFGNPDVDARTYQDYLYGVIAKIQPGSLVLTKTKFGVPASIKLNRKTKFVRSGKRSSLASLKRGDMVYVQTKKNKKTGVLTAKKVVSGMGATGGI